MTIYAYTCMRYEKFTTCYVEDRHNNILFYTYYIGGSPAWRNNNPGNLCYSTDAAAIERGAIAFDQQTNSAQRYAIFPDYTTGYNALSYCICTTYANSTIEQMMYKFAPPGNNDTEAYINYLTKQLHVSRTTKVNQLTADQQAKLVQAVANYEGYTPGTIETYP